MSREIVEALHGLEQEKGIDAETLMAALEDALLSAYKKSPGSAKYARVDLDRAISYQLSENECWWKYFFRLLLIADC